MNILIWSASILLSSDSISPKQNHLLKEEKIEIHLTTLKESEYCLEDTNFIEYETKPFINSSLNTNIY